MMEQEYRTQAEENLFHVYNRFPVVFERGEGVHLYDVAGREYLDFASGIGVMALGYHDKEYADALKEQVDKLTHTSNLYYHPPMVRAAEKVCRISGMDRVFFTNSGAEAVEGAIKTAKKYAYERNGEADHEVIAMENSFHGRTIGALSVTGTPHYREPFLPLMDGVRYAQYNDWESVLAQVTERTCAILLETIQGEGGLYPADPDFLCKIKALCEERDLLLILDEIQCGMGRSGAMFAYQKYGVRPDIVTAAKALGAGVPVGAFLVTERVAAASLKPGDHGSTYGGNPLVCAAVDKTIDIMESRRIPEHVEELSPYLEECLEQFVDRFSFVEERRGMGFMQGLQVTVPVGDVVRYALEEGLLVLSAGKNVIRFLPPLVITKEDIDRMVEIMDRVLSRF